MASIQSENDGKKGKLVALEGDTDTTSTQLRLLPPSQKILVLPSLQENLVQTPDKETFNARSFVRQVHNLFTERTQNARSFLASSTDVQPRLVFTNGGSLSARSTCIARIAENVTDGNIDEAESIFNEIVKDGVAGLLQCEEEAEVVTREAEGSAEQDELQEVLEDPTIAAMKAAESLDRVAAGLDPDESVDDAVETLDDETTLVEAEDTDAERNENDDDEMENETTPKGHLASHRLNFKAARTNTQKKSRIPVRELIFTAPRGEEIKRTVVVLPSTPPSFQDRRSMGSQIPQLTPCSAVSHSFGQTPRQKPEDEGADDFDIYSPDTETFPSTPVVVYGEACLVDMQSAEMESRVRKVKSVDRFFPSLFANAQPSLSPKHLKQTMSSYQLQPRPMTSEGFGGQPAQYFQTLPRTTFVRASQKTIRRSPASSDASSSTVRVFADRGTDAEELIPESQTKEKEIIPFEPVFPIVEDLILNLTPKGSDALFESVIASYRNGSYPAYPKVEFKSEVDSGEVYREDEDSLQQRPTSNMTAETDDAGFERRHTYDPYAYHPDVKKQWPVKDLEKRRANATHTMEPPTPCMTPLPNGIAEKILDFPAFHSNNALSLQNSLRQVLSVIFPLTDGYSQHMYKVPAEMERLWKPVFEIDESGAIGENGRTVDLIVALGCEAGVKPDFFSQISGQIEKLGTKRNGMSRSGKLDIRYCIASAMQNFPDTESASPKNPLLHPELLASLLVPQIEAYLATNASVRFLILHYTSIHLPTILALQNLLGRDLLKVAGILDTLSSDPPPISRPRGTQINPLSNEATMARPPSRRGASRSSSSLSFNHPTTPPVASFSKANYLIPSTATDTEITLFLSGIWKPLMDKSAFYMPEIEPPKPTPSARPMTPRMHTPKSPIANSLRNSNNADMSYPPSSFRVPRTSDKISRLAGGQKYAQSIASTRTTASERGRREDREWENFYIADEDSDDDEFDKMILGREYKRILPEVKIVGQKRNTKKALKWLGLA